jgi:hypothetical protein
MDSAPPPWPVSPDGRYRWDGVRWVPTISSDGFWWWDGWAWRPRWGQANQGPPHSRAVVTASVIGAIVAALLMVAVVLAAVVGRDPTDPARFNDVTVTNDLSQPVTLMQCDVHCDELHDRYDLRLGEHVSVSISDEDVPTGYLVRDSRGRYLGCLTFRYTRKEAGLHMNVSRLTATPPRSCPEGG